jgi:hypothetical protein
MVSRLVGRENMHEIASKIAQMEARGRGKMKKFIRKRSAVAIAAEHVFSNLNNAETRVVRAGLVK